LTPGRFYDVVIVGTGHAGAQAAIALRQRGFSGTLCLLGNETELPYERPPLSKDYLSGEKDFARILIRPREFWVERAIDLLQGHMVVAIDPVGHRVVMADGLLVGYGRLIWAAGGAPRTLQCRGAELRGVHVIRTRDDVDRLIGEVADAGRIVVIGGGFVGLEAAAVLTGLGKSVVLAEAEDRVLARASAEPLSRFYETEHRARGVEFHLGAVVRSLTGDGERVSGVALDGGQMLPCELVIVGIGIVPAIEPLRAAGAAIGDGVLVDDQCRTSLPDVFAIGDCAAHPNPFADGAVIRLESVQNATDQASLVAEVITGGDAHFHAVPWFWSHQYDLKLQTVGLSRGYDQIVMRGDPTRRSFSIIYLRQKRVIALDCVNATRDFVQGRALVMAGGQLSADQLADPAQSLQTTMRDHLASGRAAGADVQVLTD